MHFQKLKVGIFICCFSANLLAQTDVTPTPKNHKFTLYAGVGPNIYFNNLVIAKEYVKELNYSFTGRFMWEPEHLLSLGVESGYYRLYTVDLEGLSDASISNYAIPIQLVISMKFLKTFYFNFSSGQSILINKVSTPKYGDIDASTLSLGDFAGSIGYRKKMKNRISMGVETKFFYSAKLNDKNIALMFMFGYSL